MYRVVDSQSPQMRTGKNGGRWLMLASKYNFGELPTFLASPRAHFIPVSHYINNPTTFHGRFRSTRAAFEEEYSVYVNLSATWAVVITDTTFSCRTKL